MQANPVVISGRVRLARNYHDLPFPNRGGENDAELCLTRAQSALEDGRYAAYRMRELTPQSRMELVEDHLISRDLSQNSEGGAALIRDDGVVSIMVNEEDHLRIQAIVLGFDLEAAAREAVEAERRLQSACAFSFDPQLGYLTACPTNTGTGMRASLMMHLPMLTRLKQMGNIGQSVAKLGLTMRGLYGEGSEALADLYQVSNQVTLGRTEGELVEAVIAVGMQLCGMEDALRKTTLAQKAYDFKDVIFRSYGVMRYARQMDEKEFMLHWSNLRMGAACGLLDISLEDADKMLTLAQNAHVAEHLDASQPDITVNRARCDVIRELMEGKPQGA